MSRILATLDANDEICGPINVPGQASVMVAITGTITVTPEFSHDQLTYIAVTDEALTATGTLLLEGPGVWRLKASGVSDGSAVCSIMARR